MLAKPVQWGKETVVNIVITTVARLLMKAARAWFYKFILFYQTQKKIDEFENEENLEDLFIAKRSGRIATTWLSSKYR